MNDLIFKFSTEFRTMLGFFAIIFLLINFLISIRIGSIPKSTNIAIMRKKLSLNKERKFSCILSLFLSWLIIAMEIITIFTTETFRLGIIIVWLCIAFINNIFIAYSSTSIDHLKYLLSLKDKS